MARGGHSQARHRVMGRRVPRRFLPRVEDLESRRLLTGPTIGQFPIQFNRAPQDVTIGSDGNVYCTDSEANSIDELNLTTHAISTYPIPVPNSEPTAITSVPKANIYFIESNLNALRRAQPDDAPDHSDPNTHTEQPACGDHNGSRQQYLFHRACGRKDRRAQSDDERHY